MIWKQRAVRVSDDVWYELKKEALRLRIPTSELVRQIIVAYLKEIDEKE